MISFPLRRCAWQFVCSVRDILVYTYFLFDCSVSGSRLSHVSPHALRTVAGTVRKRDNAFAVTWDELIRSDRFKNQASAASFIQHYLTFDALNSTQKYARIMQNERKNPNFATQRREWSLSCVSCHCHLYNLFEESSGQECIAKDCFSNSYVSLYVYGLIWMANHATRSVLRMAPLQIARILRNRKPRLRCTLVLRGCCANSSHGR